MSECGEDLKRVAKEIQPHFPVGAAVCIQASDYVDAQQVELEELRGLARSVVLASKHAKFSRTHTAVFKDWVAALAEKLE